MLKQDIFIKTEESPALFVKLFRPFIYKDFQHPYAFNIYGSFFHFSSKGVQFSFYSLQQDSRANVTVQDFSILHYRLKSSLCFQNDQTVFMSSHTHNSVQSQSSIYGSAFDSVHSTMLNSKNEPNIFEQFYQGRASDFQVQYILKFNRTLFQRESGIHSHAIQFSVESIPSKQTVIDLKLQKLSLFFSHLITQEALLILKPSDFLIVKLQVNHSLPLLLKPYEKQQSKPQRKKPLSLHISCPSLELLYETMTSIRIHKAVYNKKVTIPKLQLGLQTGNLQSEYDDPNIEPLDVELKFTDINFLLSGTSDSSVHLHVQVGDASALLHQQSSESEILRISGEEEKILVNLNTKTGSPTRLNIDLPSIHIELNSHKLNTILCFEKRITEDINSLVHFYKELQYLEQELHFYSNSLNAHSPRQEEFKEEKTEIVERDSSYNNSHQNAAFFLTISSPLLSISLASSTDQTISAKVLLGSVSFKLKDYQEEGIDLSLDIQKWALFDGTVGNSIQRREFRLQFEQQVALYRTLAITIDSQKQGLSLQLHLQDQSTSQNLSFDHQSTSGFQNDFVAFMKKKEKNKKMEVRLKVCSLLLKPELKSTLRANLQQIISNFQQPHPSLLQFRKEEKTFVKLRVWIDSIVLDLQKQEGGLVLWLKAISLSSLNYMLEKIKRLTLKTERLSVLLLPDYKQIITHNSLIHCVNISELSKFDGSIQSSISMQNSPQIKLTLNFQKAFFTFKKDSYVLFNRSLNELIASIEAENKEKLKQAEQTDLNSQFFVQSSSKYETDFASMRSLDFEKGEASREEKKAKEEEKKAYGFEFVSENEINDITVSQHAVLHEMPGLMTDYIAKATIASHPLEMSIHQETLKMNKGIAGLSLGLTVGEFYFKLSRGRDFKKSKGNFRQEYAFVKLDNFAVSFRLETDTTKGQIGVSIQEMEVGDQEGNELGMALGKENKLNPDPIAVLVIKYRHISQLKRVMLRSSLNIQPLAFRIRQRFLMFLLQFFGINLLKQEQPKEEESPEPKQKERESPLYLQKLRIEPISISLNYTSEKLLNISQLSSGNILQILNLVNIRDLELKFTRYEKEGADIEQFLQQFASSLLDQISSNQKLSIVASVGPVRTIVNIGNALIDLVARPIQQSSRKGVIRSFLTGVKDLGVTLGKEGTLITTTTLSSLMSLLQFSKYEI